MDPNKRVRRRQFLKMLSASSIAFGLSSEFLPQKILFAQQNKNIQPKEVSNINATQSNSTAFMTNNTLYKNLRYSNLIGSLKDFSAAQIRFHLIYYKRCCDKLKALEETKDSIDLSSSDPLESPWRDYLLSVLDLRNKVLLHDLYFSCLSPINDSITTPLKNNIENSFGSLDQWWIEFKATAMSIRAWAVFAWDTSSKKLINFGLDYDTQFPVGIIPLLVIDVHEHAYVIDYPGDRLSYLDAFYKNISWTTLNNRFKQIKI